jgi:hypothetical protein
MLKLSAKDEENLVWFVREAASEVSGLGAQNYAAVGGGSYETDRIRESQLRASDRYRRIDAVRVRLQEMDGGVEAWGILAMAFREPRRDDPMRVYEEKGGRKKLVRDGLPAEIANLARYTPSALARGATLEAGRLPHERAVLAVHAAIEAKDQAFLSQVQVEAREMLARAGERYVLARRELHEEDRLRKARATVQLDDLGSLVARLRAEDDLTAALDHDAALLDDAVGA